MQVLHATTSLTSLLRLSWACRWRSVDIKFYELNAVSGFAGNYPLGAEVVQASRDGRLMACVRRLVHLRSSSPIIERNIFFSFFLADCFLSEATNGVYFASLGIPPVTADVYPKLLWRMVECTLTHI